MLEFLISKDRELFVWLNSLGNPYYDPFWITFTKINTWIPLYVLLFLLIFRSSSRKTGLRLVLTVLLAVILAGQLSGWVKLLVGRLRPNNDPEFAGIIRILQEPVDFSFFSGHASFSVALTGLTVLLLRKKYRWIYALYLWPLLLAYSRIYVGVHFPGDLLVGSLVGTGLALLTYILICRKLAPEVNIPDKP